MKTLIIFIFSVFIFISVEAQDNCGKYYPFKEGDKFEIAVYDKKEKPSTVIDYKMVSIKNSGGDEIGTVNSRISDEKGKEIGSSLLTKSKNINARVIEP